LAKESVEQGFANAVGVWDKRVSSTMQCGASSNSRRLVAGQNLLVTYDIVIKPTNAAVTVDSVANTIENLSAPAVTDLVQTALLANGVGNVSVNVVRLSKPTLPARYFTCAAPVHTTNFTNLSMLQAAAAEQAQSQQDPCYKKSGLPRRLWCQNDMKWLLPLVFSLLAVVMVFGPVALARIRPQQAKQSAPQPPIIPASLEAGDAKVAETEKSPRTLVLLPSAEPRTLLAQSHAPSKKSFFSEPGSPACTSQNSTLTSVEGIEVHQPEDQEAKEPGLMNLTKKSSMSLRSYTATRRR